MVRYIRTVASVACMVVGLAASSSALAQSSFPDRPIQMIVPWGAGGGTDAVGRVFASILQQELGFPVNVINRTGGSGVVGHSAIANAEPDGYTLGIMTIEIDMMHWQGLTELTYKDFDILAIVNSDPGGIMVSTDSPTSPPRNCSPRSRPSQREPPRARARGRAASGMSASPAGCSRKAFRRTR